mmetsp:Transcript_9279/g.26039  ORF Transcript_9279/g.26039 Transcript_9279/m.26039 type:complete len:312 (-) Transcript_9279:21-956(-)
MVERHGHADVLCLLDVLGAGGKGAKALHRRPRGQQIVDARRGDELVVGAAQACGLRIHEADVGINDVARLAAQLLGQQLQQRRMVPGVDAIFWFILPADGAGSLLVEHLRAQDWLQVRLSVHCESLALICALQVDGEVGDDHDPPVHAHELLGEVARLTAADDHLPCKAQRPVEPGVPEAPAVGLDSHLHHVAAGDARVGTEPEAGGVRVRANHRHARLPLGRELAANNEGHDVGAALGHEVLAPGCEGPGFAVVQLFKAAVAQEPRAGGDGVVRRSGLVHELEEEFCGLQRSLRHCQRCACDGDRARCTS